MTSRAGTRFHTRFSVHDRTLVVDLVKPRRVLSSAVKGGGLVTARYILTHQVAANPTAAPTPKQRWSDPARHLSRLARRLGLQDQTVGLMTAVDLHQLVAIRTARAELWIEAFVTVGVTNAVRAGDRPQPTRHRRIDLVTGTINMIFTTNGRLTPSAMVTAIQVATESKTAVLLREGVPTLSGDPGATGTGTDATVVACGDGPALRYAGTHTRFGSMLGSIAQRAVTMGLLRSRRKNRLD